MARPSYVSNPLNIAMALPLIPPTSLPIVTDEKYCAVHGTFRVRCKAACNNDDDDAVNIL